MKHIVITRVNFNDETLFQNYLTIMKEVYVPAINSQKNKNFELGFIIKPHHIPIIDELFDNQKITYFDSMEDVKKYCYENNIELQTRHDCDDWMSEDYISKIQDTYNEKVKDYDKFIIHSKVKKLNFYTYELYNHGINYGNYISMFLTLCQKKVDSFVYDNNHRHMGNITKNIFLIDNDYTRLVVHKNNIHSTINSTDKKIGDIKKYDLTIIIPTYDNVEYIVECLDSIIKSKEDNSIEVLVGIDACNKTKNFILKNYKTFKSEIKFYFFENNVGPYIIKNSLSQISKSNKILFVDSDDILDKNMINETIKNLKNNDIVRFKFYNFESVDELENLNPKNINQYYSIGVFGINKNKFMEQNGFEPWVCGADSEFNNRTIGNNFKVSNLDNLLYYRRRHKNSLTINSKTNWTSKIRKEYNRIIKKRVREKKFNKLIDLPVTKFYNLEEDSSLNLVNKKDNLYLFQLENKTKLDLSVIVPTYNNVNYIYECIESIINSSNNFNIEILIGIDGCVKTKNYLKDLNLPKNIKVFYFNENLGPYSIKNTLAKIAYSDKLIFFDSDDIMNPNMIDTILNGLNRYVCVKPKFEEFNGKSLGGTKFGEGVFGIKKDVFISMNGFEPWKMAADSDFMGRLYKKRTSILHTPQILFKRRIHPESLTNKKETGMYSPLRAHYARLSKNKKGHGNPKELNVREYVELNIFKDLDIDNAPLKEKNSVLNLVNRVQQPTKQKENKQINYELVNKVIYNKQNNKKNNKKGSNSLINKNLNVRKQIFKNLNNKGKP